MTMRKMVSRAPAIRIKVGQLPINVLSAPGHYSLGFTKINYTSTTYRAGSMPVRSGIGVQVRLHAARGLLARGRVRNHGFLRSRLARAQTFVREKEEGLVSENGPAEHAAEVVLPLLIVPRLTAATFASAIAALEGSVTRPVMEAFVVCARSAQGYRDKRRTSRRAGTLYIVLTWSSAGWPLSCHFNLVSATITDL